MTTIYKITHADGSKSLVRAETAKGALRFKREQIILTAEKASQEDLIAMLRDGADVETASPQVDVEGKQP